MAPSFTKLGLIAGGGGLPRRILEEQRAIGAPVLLLRLAGAADDDLHAAEEAEFTIGEAGGILSALTRSGCDAVCLAGNVKRPEFSKLKMDMRGAKLAPKLVAAGLRGDGAILDVLVATFENEGFKVVGADDLVAGLIAESGKLGEKSPSKEDLGDIAKAASLIDALGPFDVGQGAVIAAGQVLAVEAAEGTDLMLVRCATLAKKNNARGVLVKRPKPGQERRVDLPVIGPETVRGAVDAGLRGIAIEAGGALVMERDSLIALANEAGIFVYGFVPEDLLPR